MFKARWISVLITLMLSVFLVRAQYDFSVCEQLNPVSQACRELMEVYPEPNVLEIARDGYTLSSYSFWKVETTQAPVFDAPNGTIVRNFGLGFNFVNVLDSTSTPDWVKIESGEWMRTADVRYVPASEFKGVRLLDGLENTFAWSLGMLFTSAYPGGPQDSDNGRLLFRFDRVNIFAEAYDEAGWRWYMVGPDQWIEQRLVSKPLRVDRPEGVEGRWISVDLYEQALIAWENDTPVFATLISSGLPGTETNEGLFEIWAALPRDRMSGAAGAPNGWDLQSVPWVMYFDDSISLHGTYWHENFGYRRSRGCVNLSISDARWLFEWMSRGNVDGVGTPVYVYSSGEYRRDGAATK
ncbi:MAG: L,D-transpeptidase [Anaerolineae bacterium]|jgi:hypothetical protein|nr:L,D-transpeptidase [Anaerolineae bacterium]